MYIYIYTYKEKNYFVIPGLSPSVLISWNNIIVILGTLS